ncbi:hypothetical protein A3K74_01415 [Candidatus Pacearchaeota archaeon RBG_13_33_26]|nr:MAG: hypothetical protein A3K74_01415 [Candidatus Pacearchaeota archaeon RBG_13_33_26]
MNTERFFREKNMLENRLRNYAINDRHDHHQGYMHVRYDDFFEIIDEYKNLFSSEDCPFRKDANDEVKKFLEEEIIRELKGKKCEHCTAIANLIEVECMPK